ncbi:MAG: HAMP domain-containing sensor histidine kinase [Alphaproteobacteria bacterium]|nr:HAMP domain-containing sensor histidine kinase [Alphaproteobacteria bacterium]
MRTKPGLLQTQAFRIVLVYVLLFAFSVTALLFFTYWNTRRALDGQTDRIIEAEITGLREEYQHFGLPGLVETVRARTLHQGQALYMLSDNKHHVLAGNLAFWPQLSEMGSLVEFNYERPVDGKLKARRARGRVLLVPGDFMLLVSQDVHDRYLTERMFTTTLPWTVLLILLLGTAGGALIGRNMLRRLDAINRTSGEIIAGDLTRRVPLAGSGDEFDALAENLNRMLDRIERLMKGMREVTDSVAHDLRTPLNRLRNRLEESVARLNTSGAQAGEIERAIAETDQLIATFNALLLIAETGAGTARAAMSPLDLGEVAADVTELYEPLADEKKILLTLLPGPPAGVEANRSLVAQALANLVDNAIKYTPAGGQVRIATAVNDEVVDLSVSDTGPGIPLADRPRVIERFVRLEASRSSPGTGLGLSLVAAVAHYHGADLMLEDNTPTGLKAVLRFQKSTMRALPGTPLKSAAE